MSGLDCSSLISSRSSAKSAKAEHLGLWGACPRTPYDAYHGIETRR
jgi:hypothetical protein